jgi:hypothetical protein
VTEFQLLNEQVLQKVFCYTFAPAGEWKPTGPSRDCDRWLPPKGSWDVVIDAYSAKEQSGRRYVPMPNYSTDITDSWLVVTELATLGWRLTLTAPGGFTDEGLGGGDPKDGHWTAVFQRPLPEQLPDEDYINYTERIKDYEYVAYAEAATAPLAICLAALTAVEG